MSQALADAFRMGRMVVAASSYDAGLFPPMHDFLYHLKIKNFQNRRVAILENGSWAPTAGKVMRAMLDEMKSIDVVDPVVTIKSRMKESDKAAIKEMVSELLR